jgi:hypothetical protein
MMEYKILSDDTAHKLQTQVNFWLEHGYVPHGNMSIKPEVNGFMNYESAEYCQPMIKHDGED